VATSHTLIGWILGLQITSIASSHWMYKTSDHVMLSTASISLW